jgi:SAM-dependent methyltransferase
MENRSSQVSTSTFADALLGMLDRMPTPVAWRSWRARRAGVAFDRRYGTDTQDHVDVTALGVDSAIAQHAVRYEPSAIPKVQCALRHLGVRPEAFAFVDVGSGKGLVPLLAARRPFRSIVGLEASAELVRVAERNLALYAAREALTAPVVFLNVDALDYEFGERDQIVYLYNPFDEAMLRRLVDRLLSVARPAELLVVYVNPVHRRAIDKTGAFRTLFENGSLAVFRRRTPELPDGPGHGPHRRNQGW